MGFLDSMKSRLGFDNGNDEEWAGDDDYDDRPEDDGFDEGDDGQPDYGSDSSSVRLVTRDARSYSSARSTRYGSDTDSAGSSTSYRTSSRASQRSQQAPIDVFSDEEPGFLKDRGVAPVTSIDDARGHSTSVRSATRSDAQPSTAYDPYRDYLEKGQADLLPLAVISPTSYNDAQEIAKTFKTGRSVALSLRSTRPELAKRILDFSFGVACALSGKVEKVSDRVFLITHNPLGLTDDERKQLTAHGLM